MTGRLDRRRLIGGVAALALAAPASAQIVGNIKSIIPGTGFSVSGKPGPYVRQIARQKFEPGGADAENKLGFGAGEFQSARLPMPQTQARLEALIRQIGEAWPYAKPPQVKVHMIAEGRFGPVALPDGSIAVPVGFLVRAESDDEVSFVLGHEYAHLALGHFARNERLKTQRKIITTAAQIYTGGILLSQVRLQQGASQARLAVADQRKVDAANSRASHAKDRLDWILNVLVEPVWNRRQEDEADAIGFDLAQAIGYSSTDGAAAAFSRLTADNAEQKATVGQLQDQLGSSLKEANSITNQASLKRGDAGGFLMSFSKGIQSGLEDRALKATESFLSAQHRSPQVRQKGISDYAQAAYPQGKLVNLKTTWLNATRANREYVNAKTAVAALQRAQQARFEEKYAEAEAAIRQALATPFGSLPLFVNELARIYRDKGDFRNAEAQFSRADAHAEQTFDGFRDHVQMNMAVSNWARALAIIEIYKGRTRTDKEFLPQMVRIQFRQGHTDEAVKLLQRCVELEEPELRSACAVSAYGPDDAEWDKLPESSKSDIKSATNKASTRLSVSADLGNMLKSLQKSDDK